MNLAYARFSRGAVISAFATGSFYLRNICLLPLLTRFFGADEYGLWIQIIGLVELLSGVATLKLNNALQRFLPSRKEAGLLAGDMASILLVVGAIGVSLALVLGLGADAWLPVVSEDFDLVRKVTFVLVPTSALFQVIVSYFRASQQTGTYSAFLMVESFGYIGLALVALIMGAGLWGVVGALSLVRLVTGLSALALMFRQIGWSRPSLACLPGYLRFSLPLMPMAVFAWINSMADRYVIAWFHGDEATGVYSISYAIANIAGLLFAPIFFVFGPAITHLWERDDRPALKELLLYSQKYPFLLTGPLIIVIVFYNEWIIDTFATSEYQADPLLALLIAGGIVFMNVSSFAENFIALLHKTKVLPVIWGAGSVLNVSANLAVVPFWGLKGAAFTTLMTFVLQSLFSFVYVRRYYPIKYNSSIVSKCAIASALMVSLILPFREGTFVVQAASFFTGIVGYVLSLVLMKGFERREFDFFRRLLSGAA